MSFRFAMIMLVVAAAWMAAHHRMAAGSEPGRGAATKPAATARAPVASPPAVRTARERESSEAGALAPLVSGSSRVRQAFGNAGAKIVAPTVAGMTARTEGLLDEMTPAVNRAPPIRRQRAEKAAKQIRELDKAALAQVEEGRPVAALRSAMRARELLDIVRQQIIEEAIR